MNIKKEILNFKNRALVNIQKNYNCTTRKAYIIAKITKNDSYYRINCYKYLRLYMGAKNKFKALHYYRKYSHFSHIINCQLICQKIGENFYFEHGNIIINQNAVIGDNVRLIGNNCIGGGKKGAPILGNNITLGWGACIVNKVIIGNDIVIGANSTITKDLLESGTYIGVNKKIVGDDDGR